MIGGTNSVATITPSAIRLPANSRRASAYAAGAAVNRTTAPVPSAAITEFRNHRRTRVCAEEEKIVSSASPDQCEGSSVGGEAADSSSVLNAVSSIHRIGARYNAVSAISAAQRSAR